MCGMKDMDWPLGRLSHTSEAMMEFDWSTSCREVGGWMVLASE